MLDLFTSIEDYGNTLDVRVTPKASKNYIKVEHNEDCTKLIRVYVTVAAEDGKANDAVIKLLAKELGLPKSILEIIRGHKTRNKVIRING